MHKSFPGIHAIAVQIKPSTALHQIWSRVDFNFSQEIFVSLKTGHDFRRIEEIDDIETTVLSRTVAPIFRPSDELSLCSHRVSGGQAGRQAGRQAGWQAGRQAGRKEGRKEGRRAGRQASRQPGRQAGRLAGAHAGRWAGGQVGRLADGPVGRQAGG
jgi:hypothetical protein